MKDVNQLITQWWVEVRLLEVLLEKEDKATDMFCIMITRKNQLLECIKDLEKL